MVHHRLHHEPQKPLPKPNKSSSTFSKTVTTNDLHQDPPYLRHNLPTAYKAEQPVSDRLSAVFSSPPAHPHHQHKHQHQLKITQGLHLYTHTHWVYLFNPKYFPKKLRSIFETPNVCCGISEMGRRRRRRRSEDFEITASGNFAKRCKYHKQASSHQSGLPFGMHSSAIG